MPTRTCYQGRAQIERCGRSVTNENRSDGHVHPSQSDCRNAPSAAQVLHWRRLETTAPVTFIKLFISVAD